MATPPDMSMTWGHVTRFSGGKNYPHDTPTRPDAIYDQRSLPTECVECGAMEPVFESWDPAADDRAVHGGAVLYALAAWLEELDQHRDPQGRLYDSYADALRLLATALPHGDHLWRDTVAAEGTPATPSTEDTPHVNV